MRHMVAVGLLALIILLTTPPAYAGPPTPTTYNVEWAGGWGGSSSAVAAQGSRVFAGLGLTLVALDA